MNIVLVICVVSLRWILCVCHDVECAMKKFFKNLKKKDATSTAAKIVIAFCSPSHLGQESAKRSFGLRVKLPPVNPFITHGESFTQFPNAERQAVKL